MGNRKKCKSKNRRSGRLPRGDNDVSRDPEDSSPFSVEVSEVLGSYLTARRDLDAGEIIMVDESIVVGPCQESKPMCIGCFTDLDLENEESYKRPNLRRDSYEDRILFPHVETEILSGFDTVCGVDNISWHNLPANLWVIVMRGGDQEKIFFLLRCPRCSWPLCSTKCPGSHLTQGSNDNPYLFHTYEECDFLSTTMIKKADSAVLKTCFYAITPLRLLMIKLFKPETWKVIMKMESHTEARRKNEKLWKTNHEMAVEKIIKVFGLSQFSAEQIHFACGVLEVNAFEVSISNAGQPLRAIYPNAYLFSHDCVPNTSHSNGEGFSMIVRTNKFIPKDSPLTVSYTYTLQSTLNRRKHLLDTKFFHCICERCRDNTEFGVYCSAFKCPTCKTGLVLPQDPLVDTCDWLCGSRKCSYKVPVSLITQTFERISNELDSINGNDIEGYEDFLRKYEDTLHENHCLCLSALHSLSQLYGKINGYIVHELTDDQLDRKIQICRILLKVFEKLEPGLSKQRGILLYELQAPLMIILNRRFQQQNITRKELKQKLGEVTKCLEETCKIFAFEWNGAPEGIIASAAKEAIENMKGWKSVTNLL